jgi:hypothetical protein
MAVERSIEALSPEVILMCQCSVDRSLENLVSRMTRSMGEAGDTFSVRINSKECKVVSAFHPSAFAKDSEEGKPLSRGNILKAALLEFCFLHAMNVLDGNGIVGNGIHRLRDLALG